MTNVNETVEAPATDNNTPGDGAEAAAHTILRLTADFPGQMGRVRTARIAGGYAVSHRDEYEAKVLERYSIDINWTIREMMNLVDALMQGGLIAQTHGLSKTLVLTRAGFMALIALEGAES